MIKIEGLSKIYAETIAVDGLSFQVNEGEILGLVGPNGAGKTTTMRCITGIIPATSGEIHVGPYSIKDHALEAKQQMAFVPAEVRLFDHLTVREHLLFFQRLYSTQESGLSPDGLLDELSLTEKKHQLPGALSRGMKQKLMIACALIHMPKVLIMDEPFTGLDPHAIRLMRTLLEAHARTGAVVVISSHLLGMVEGLVSKVLIIQHGRRVAYGSLAELQDGMPELRADAGLEEIFIELTSGIRQNGEQVL